MQKRWWIGLLAIAGCCGVYLLTRLLVPTAVAEMTARKKSAVTNRSISKIFHVPPALKPAVDFWRDIYAAHDKDHVVLHDTEHLQITYGVVDLTDISRHTEWAPTEIGEARQARVREAKERVRETLARLSADPDPSTWSTEEKRFVKLFAPLGGADAMRAAMADDRLRSQTGQRDKFVAGITIAGRYMSLIEQIFKEHGVPWEASRLAFVESMFNLRAYSKVGASGLWQFMPGTARLYGLTTDRYIDERSDPVAATHAAARLLKNDFAQLGAWPLAINAYNAGRGRLQQAVARLGTTDIAKIIHNFAHPGYGFASRNFYPEFLAALDVYENYRTYFGELSVDAPLEFESIVTTAPVPLPQLARMTETDLDTLQALNPAYTDAVITGALPLPPGYTLKVPAHHGTRFMAAIDRIYRELPQHGFYVVQAGETLPAVASKVGISPRDLRALNGIRKDHLTPGQVLKLPVGALSTFGTAAAQPE